ncbi:MAG: DUF4983 domain-containing protein, partial [Rhodothermales bacterium]|nr:DUF4983 domain-containing protein [Rhodothermales bacterium]
DLYPDFLTRLEQIDPAWNTFAVLDWPPLGTTNANGPLFSDLIDVKVNVNGDTMGYPAGDALSCRVAAQYLSSEPVDAAFVYLGNPDVASHDHGTYAEPYREAIEEADRCVGLLVDALESRPDIGEEDWLILSSTDHGRNEDGGHGGDSEEELTIYYLASGASVDNQATGVPEIVDVAVTALAHLGVAIAPDWKLDGKVMGLKR